VKVDVPVPVACIRASLGQQLFRHPADLFGAAALLRDSVPGHMLRPSVQPISEMQRLVLGWK
jgi:hypothetical protein